MTDWPTIITETIHKLEIAKDKSRMIGKLNCIVEPGTIMGPTYNKEMVTALSIAATIDADGKGGWETRFRHTQTKDFSAVPASGPRSVTEHAMIQVKRSPFGPIRTMDPYEMPVAPRLPTMAENIDFGRRMGGGVMPAKLITGRGENGGGGRVTGSVPHYLR